MNVETPVVERDSRSDSFALTGIVRDNWRAKSDPALRQQPGSWPNLRERSDVTNSTRIPQHSTTLEVVR